MGKRSSRALVAVLGLVASGLMAAGQAVPAAAETSHTANAGRAWAYSDAAQAYWRTPQPSSPPAADAEVWVQYSGAKQLACPEDDDAFACQGDGGGGIVGVFCSDEPGPAGLPTYAWIRWERTVFSDGTATPWVGRDGGCDEPGNDDVVPMHEISSVVDATVFEPAGPPNINLWQRGQAVRGTVQSGIPVIMATDYPMTISPEYLVSIDPSRVRVPVRIPRPGGGPDLVVDAVADYEWIWNGGSAHGRGTPYKQSPFPVKYLTATFPRPGMQTLTLTATWTGTATAGGLAPEEIQPIETSPYAEDLRVL